MKWAWMKASAAVAAVGYCASLAAIWARQEKMLFKPDPFSKLSQNLIALRSGRPLGRRVKEWHHRATDGIKIQAFISLPQQQGLSGLDLTSTFKVKPDTAHPLEKKMPALIYLGGIREESSWTLPLAELFPKMAFVCVNYRGYGTSEGSPAEKDILRDTEAVLLEMQEKGFIDLSQSVLVGRSLGSGVAGYLCSKIKPKACCLITPYDSVMAVAKKKYWFLPVDWIFRHPFNAIPWAKQNEAPLLMVLAEKDEVVPHKHSLNLFETWQGTKQHLVLDKTDHSSIVLDTRLFPLIAKFAQEQESKEQSPLAA